MKTIKTISFFTTFSFLSFTAQACDLSKAETLWNKCVICHMNSADGAVLVGPNLFGIMGREVASVDAFFYRFEMESYGDFWTPELLNKFLENPMQEVPGTTMAFAGFSQAEDRENIICYLQEYAK